MRLPTLTLIGLLVAGSLPAFAQSHTGMPMGGGTATAGSKPDSMPASMMDSMTKMNGAMNSAPMTGDADHDFVVMMIPHHQGAIDMARFELQHGNDPTLRKLAREIVAAQDKEIALMQRWLDRHHPRQ